MKSGLPSPASSCSSLPRTRLSVVRLPGSAARAASTSVVAMMVRGEEGGVRLLGIGGRGGAGRRWGHDDVDDA